jgi:hypothetical protein
MSRFKYFDCQYFRLVRSFISTLSLFPPPPPTLFFLPSSEFAGDALAFDVITGH